MVFLATLAVNASAQPCPEPSLRAARNFDSGLDEPFAIAVADFNHDGNSDLVVGGSGPPNVSSRNLSVLIGNGNGSFEQPLVLIAHPLLPGHPTGFAVGDFDRDGNEDIVVSQGALRIFYGDGAGRFQDAVEYLIPGEPERVYAADLNNDGKTDLVNFVSQTSPFLSILIGNSSGGFDQVPGPQLTFPTRLVLADFNGDAKIDLLVANQSVLQVGLGDGSGHFVPLPAVTININTASVPQVSDFNLDGKLDVVITGGIADFTVFFPGDGSGGLGSPITTQSNINVQATADFNGDGKPDLAGYEPSSGIFRIGVGDGAGHFTESAPRGIGGLSFGMVAGDFNSDGKNDLASINPRADDISIVFGDGAGDFEAGQFYNIGNTSQVTAAAAGDFNGDGKIDFAVTDTSRRILFFDGNGTGGFTQGRVVLGVVSYNYSITGDFNHDGIMDLVCASDVGNQFIIIFGGLDDTRIRGAGLQGANSVTTGDFNRDGHLDIAASGLDSFGIVLGNGEMVKAFITSTEYRQRFGP